MSAVETARETPRAASLAPLYLANLVCSMGMMGFVATAGPLADALGLEAWHIGVSATAGGLGWVLAARAWGGAADRIGRKPVLTFGLAGFALGYLLLCLAVQAGAQWGVGALVALGTIIVARFGMGLAYAAIPAAGSAIIADRFAPEARPAAMGRLGAAQAAGLLFGPALVAAVAGPSPVLPLFLLALLPILALFFLILRLAGDKTKAEVPAPALSLRDPRLARQVLAALLAMIAIGTAQIVVGFVALDRLALSRPDALRVAGLALAAVGVTLIVAQMAIGRLNWSTARLHVLGGMFAAIGMLAAAFAPTPSLLILSYAFAGFGAGWLLPAISAAVANAVEAQEQGRGAGAVSTALGIGATTGPLVGGVLYDLNALLPLLAAALAMAAASAAGWAATPAKPQNPVSG
ncbi:MAG: MFS transporter [Pseudomonadota bacterium]